MSKNQNKTQATKVDPTKFIKTLKDMDVQQDCLTILELMKGLTQEVPVMWGPSIIGFGEYHYKYNSGREGDFFRTGFSPRKQNLTIYIMAGFDDYADLLKKLGKHKTSKSCLYVKRLADIDLDILEEIIKRSLLKMEELYPKV